MLWKTLGPDILRTSADHVQPSWKLYSQMSVASFGRMRVPVTKDQWFRNQVWGAQQQFGVLILQISIQRASVWGMCSTKSLTGLKYLLPPCWGMIPQQTSRGLQESMTQRVQAVQTAKGGPTQYSAAGNYVWPVLRLTWDTIWKCIVMITNVYKYIFHQHVPIGTVCSDLSAPLLPGLTLDLHIIENRCK